MGKKKKDKRTNNNLQNITHKTKDGVTKTPLSDEHRHTIYHIAIILIIK